MPKKAVAENPEVPHLSEVRQRDDTTTVETRLMNARRTFALIADYLRLEVNQHDGGVPLNEDIADDARNAIADLAEQAYYELQAADTAIADHAPICNLPAPFEGEDRKAGA